MSKSPANGVTLIGYINGYALSLYLTITAYLLVTHRVFSHHRLVIAVVILALIQFLVQAYYFLHLGHESKPRWKLYVFLFMILIVVILVLGSLWIMNNLNYHHPETPNQINHYLTNQDGL